MLFNKFSLSKETSRWFSSVCIVLFIHAIPFLWWQTLENKSGTYAPPPAAMVITLAPLPVAPTSSPDMPVGLEQTESTAPAEPKKNIEIEQEIPDLTLATQPIIAVKLKPEPEEEEREEDISALTSENTAKSVNKKPVSETSAPPDAPDKALEAAAPNQGMSMPVVNTNAIPTWQNKLMMKLNEAKRYPNRARQLHQEGIVYLRFTMNREGLVLRKSIETSTKYALLNKEALQLLKRAQPLPKMPSEILGETLELVIPVEFFLQI